MNYPEFLSQLDEAVQNLNIDSLQLCIRNMACSIPENKRSWFISCFKTSCSSEEEPRYTWQYIPIDSVLTRIEEDEIALEADYNEEYDDWYNNSVPEFLYDDPEDCLSVLEHAFILCHEYFDYAQYAKCASLSSRLAAIEIPVTGEYTDDPITFETLCEAGVSFDRTAFIQEFILSVYHSTDSALLSEAILKTIVSTSFIYESDSLSKVLLQYNATLPGISAFWKTWANYLGNRPGKIESRLFNEALQFIETKEEQIELLYKFCSFHPSSVLVFLQHEHSLSDKETYQLTCHALNETDPDYTARSETALICAEYALRYGSRSKAEHFWKEAVFSNPTYTNCLRLLCEGTDPVQNTQFILARLNQLADNTPTEERYISEEYRKAEYHPAVKEFITILRGTSEPFADSSLSHLLPLILIYQGDSSRPGFKFLVNRLCSMISFSEKEYNKGLNDSSAPQDSDLLLSCLKQCSIPTSKEEAEAILENAEVRAVRTAEFILKNQERRAYGTCAGWLAGVGEVEESFGNTDAKNNLLLSVLNKFPRHRSFRNEINPYLKK